jgi:hypothetical protein
MNNDNINNNMNNDDIENNGIVDPEYNKLIHAFQTNNIDEEFARFSVICVDGLYYGYPKCCILCYYDNYSFDTKKINCDNICKKASGRTGFIPCYNHALDIMDKKVKIGELIDYELRRSPFNFPRDPNKTITVNYMNYYEKELDELYYMYIDC